MEATHAPRQALDQAIRSAGSQSELARRIGVNQQNISHWLNKANGTVPAEQVIPIETATDGAVTRHQLRPDIYPPPAVPSEAAE